MNRAEKRITIEQVIEIIPEWRGQITSHQPLTGGLTNSNYLVEVKGQTFFVRIPGPQAELLAIDRDNEYLNSIAAAEAGVGPRVHYYLKDYNVMVMEFIPGKTMTNQDMHRPGMPARIAHSLKILHRGPRFLTDFSMFQLVQYYLNVVQEHQVEIPPDYLDRLPVLTKIEAAINTRPLETVPCHNDLVAENFIDDGNILRIVDFEYSGNNDPCFEMADAATEIGYNEAQVAEMCKSYFGRPRPSMEARIHLYGVVSDIGWVLWTAIQNKISQIDFDYWKHLMFRWGRAKQIIDSDRFPIWLEVARQKDE
jgi:thiamine kinase-like enzyme